MIKKLLRYIIQENSMYLFSGLCMLYGVYLLMGSAHGPADRSIVPDLTLLGTMKFYEILVTLTACLVFRKLRVENDGLLLTCMAVVLYLDPTLFNTRFHAAGTATGLAVNGACIALAAGGLALLARVGGLPISFAAARGVIAGAAAIYLSAGALDSAFSPIAKNSAPTQDHIYYLLWLLPLVVALAARRWREDGERPVERSSHTFRMDGRDYDVRAIRVDRYRYLDTVLCFAPFVLLVRHLYVMQGVYEVLTYAANVAPVMLGLAVLLDKTAPKLRASAPPVLIALGALAIGMSADASPMARASVFGLTLGPVHLIAALNLAAALWLFGDTGRRMYLYYALITTMPLLSGSVDVVDAVVHLRASFLVPLWLATLVAAWRTGAFADVLLAGWTTLAIGLKASGQSPWLALAVWTHGAAWWLIVMGKVYQQAWVDEDTPHIAWYLMGSTFVSLHVAPAVLWLTLPYFAGQVVLFHAMGVRRGDRTLRRTADGFGGLELGLRSWPIFSRIDFVAMARSFGGVGVIALAFVGLFVGVWISFRKDRILAWLGDDSAA